MEQLLTNETLVSVALTVAGLVWGAFKSSEWWQRRKNDRRERLLEGLEIGVQSAWDNLVKQAKRASTDGKLTPALRRTAHEHAARVASSVIGRDISAVVPRDELSPLISSIVQDMKARRGAA